jgi:hypothetical protein
MRTHISLRGTLRGVLLATAVLSVLAATGCPTPPSGPGNPDDVDAGVDEPPPPFAQSTKNRLAWKRQRAVEVDLLNALQLDKSQLCNELGLYSCADFVHLVPLGGNDPFVRSQYEPLPVPTVTTPIALDRMALSACGARADADRQGDAVVFTDLDLNAPSVDATAAAATLENLSRRLLSRSLTDKEVSELQGLTVDDDGAAVSARDFAVLACFSLATLSEAHFY